MNLGNQILGSSGDQREQLTSSAVLAVESPGRPNGIAAFAVRVPGTAVVVDVDQSRGENVPCAVDNLGVVVYEIAPVAAGSRREDPTTSESNKGVASVNAGANQPD